MLPDRFLRQILDNLTTAVLLLDSDLRLSFMNPAAEMLLAVSGQRVYQQPVQDLFTDSAAALDSLHNAVENGHPFTKREAQLTLSNGQSMMADYSVTPIIAANRNWLLMELYPRDRLLRITKEEAQLSKQETSKMLVRGLAHEIKNPLGGIRGAAQLLARELPEDGLTDYTDVIIEEADRLRNLVDSMLGPYRPPALRPINIHEITERVCSLIEAETQGAHQSAEQAGHAGWIVAGARIGSADMRAERAPLACRIPCIGEVIQRIGGPDTGYRILGPFHERGAVTMTANHACRQLLPLLCIRTGSPVDELPETWDVLL